jgi:hypothetical protein
MEDPLRALRRVAALTKKGGTAIIETEAVVLPGWDHLALCEFFGTDELNNDSSNWWSPNLRAVLSLCRAAGFSRADAVKSPPFDWSPLGRRFRPAWDAVLRGLRWVRWQEHRPMRWRAVVHAVK